MKLRPWVAAAVRSGMLEVTEQPSQADFATTFHALEEATARVVGPSRPWPLAVLLRDDSGTVAGGLWSLTAYSWVMITILFVPDSLRGQGVGTALVSVAEEAARERGCIGAQVDAFDFQAVQENNPRGHRRLYFAKPFGQ